MKSHFLLDSKITFLNHGSFGACPKPVFESYQSYQRELEMDPVDFMQNKLPDYIKKAKLSLSGFIGCDVQDFFFTPNPTVAINTVMRSLQLEPGDEILTTNHEYGAMDRTWHFYAKKTGVNYVRQAITLPITSKKQILDEFWKGYSSRTKVVFLNHISSSTALIFPVREICQKAKELGLITIIDGAHVPGHIDLNLSDLDPDFYTGTLHKWMLAPKGSSFLYVKKERQDMLEPLVVSWGYESLQPSESRFLDYHEYQGTNDHSAYLCTPEVIAFLKANQWSERYKESQKLVFEYYPKFCELLHTKPICPVTSEFLGLMASIPITTNEPVVLKELLYDRYKIQIPVMPLNDRVYLRFSVNMYTEKRDLDELYHALIDILETTDLLIL